MTEQAVKRRLTRAKDRALRDLVERGYNVVYLDRSAFHLLAFKDCRTKAVRIDLDRTGSAPKVPSWIHEAEIWMASSRREPFSVLDIKK